MKLDIPEGADFWQMPRVFGFGRVVTAPSLLERYATLRIFGWRYFIAWAKYDDKRTSFRYWLMRDK